MFLRCERWLCSNVKINAVDFASIRLIFIAHFPRFFVSISVSLFLSWSSSLSPPPSLSLASHNQTNWRLQWTLVFRIGSNLTIDNRLLMNILRLFGFSFHRYEYTKTCNSEKHFFSDRVAGCIWMRDVTIVVFVRSRLSWLKCITNFIQSKREKKIVDLPTRKGKKNSDRKRDNRTKNWWPNMRLLYWLIQW